MEDHAYNAVTSVDNGAGCCTVATGFLRVTGRDRATFLQGQLSNDIISCQPGNHLRACLLNNTGHLLAVTTVYVFEDHVLLSTDLGCAVTVQRMLERFIVRERVEIQPDAMRLITVQGPGSRQIVESIFGTPAFLCLANGTFNTIESDFGPIAALTNARFTSIEGFDLVVFADKSENLSLALRDSGAVDIDNETAHVLCVESGEPAWGAELDTTIIPMEAGLSDTISFTKGCYMGQEVIARIHSRGHTNRTLVKLQLEKMIEPESALTAIDGEKTGQEIGRVTSSALSPRLGPIALGLVRNEYADAGTVLNTLAGKAIVN
jgi:folate-binding protein YgfZ